MAPLTIKDLNVDEQMLWNRANELWKCSLDRDFKTIDEAIHPRYIGWDNNSLVPHDRNYALESVKDKSVRLLKYTLFPLGVSVYDKQVGIVNYRYKATVGDLKNNIRVIKGRWTEIYLRQGKSWSLIGVHGGPEPLEIISKRDIYLTNSKIHK